MSINVQELARLDALVAELRNALNEALIGWAREWRNLRDAIAGWLVRTGQLTVLRSIGVLS